MIVFYWIIEKIDKNVNYMTRKNNVWAYLLNNND